jgi:GAF domain-containing protein
LSKTENKEAVQPPGNAEGYPGAPRDRALETAPHEYPIKTLGDVVGFEVVTMLAMLALGIIALKFEPSSDENYWLFANPLLIYYATGVAFNLVDAMVRVRRRALLPGGPGVAGVPWRVSNYTRWRWRKYLLDPPVFNFMFDTAFLAGVIIINRNDDSLVVLLLVMFTAARFYSYVAGQPSRLVFLPVILPVLFFSLQRFYTPGNLPADNYLIHLLFAIIFVLMAYAFLSLINQRIAEEAALTAAIAERDKKIKQSEISAEHDARRLAEQVLRLDLLQDSIRAINSAIELDELLLMVVNNAVRVLKAEQSSIGLIDERTGELVIQCATGVEASKLRRKHFMPGVGVAGWVAQKGVPLVVGDVRKDTRYVDPNTDAAWARTTRSMLCVPLIAERKVIGTLCVTSSRPDDLTEEDQRLLTGFAEQAALAVHKSKLLDERTRQGEELRRRGDLIASLHSIGQSVLSSLDLPQVLETIISRMSELTSFDQALIYLLNERTGDLHRVANTGHSVLDTQSSILSPNSSSLITTLWRKAQANNTAQSCKGGTCILCLPLVNRGKTIGCIMLAREGDHQFNNVERDTAEKVADAATLAIVNARLFGTVSLQQQQTTALYRLMLKVNAASNRRQLAQLICNELQQIFGATASALLINDTEHARLSGWACYGDWLGYDVGSIVIPLQDDPFIVNVLSALHQVESPGLIVLPEAPPQVS